MRRLERTRDTVIGHGEFADVIRTDDGRVVKLFRRVDAFDDLPNPADNETLIRVAWDEEAAHYELLQHTPELAVYAPEYFGRCVVAAVVDNGGSSVLSEYVPDCAFELEMVPGQAKKLWDLPRDVQAQVNAVRDRLQLIGLRQTSDASVFVPGSRAEFTLIDFASLRNWLDLVHYVRQNRGLPQHVRQRWSSLP